MVRDLSPWVEDLLPESPAGDTEMTALLWLTARAAADLVNGVLEPTGLTADEFAVYTMLTATSTLTSTEVGRLMMAPPTTVSSLVKRFEARGEIERVRDQRDGRTYRLRLTDRGRSRYDEALTLLDPFRTQLSRRLGSREAEFRQALRVIREVLDQLRGRLGSA